jgi:hypothetical protein
VHTTPEFVVFLSHRNPCLSQVRGVVSGVIEAIAAIVQLGDANMHTGLGEFVCILEEAESRTCNPWGSSENTNVTDCRLLLAGLAIIFLSVGFDMRPYQW